MLNGAVTLGTLDGANIEIRDAAGAENFIQFGMLTEEVERQKAAGYHPVDLLYQDPALREAMDFLSAGFGGELFEELSSNLRTVDPYMVLADFTDYQRAQKEVSRIFRDQPLFQRMSLANIAAAGIFSADHSVRDYAQTIWHMRPVPVSYTHLPGGGWSAVPGSYFPGWSVPPAG